MLVSVIVPVYKAEKWLHRCVDSILVQTMKDFELLLIDDGSPDRSGEICDEYAAKDSRVRVFHKENGGVSSARNLGLDNAQGEWISFVDADDWVGCDYIKEIYDKRDGDALLIQGINHIKNDGTSEVDNFEECIYEGERLSEFFDIPLYGFIASKLFKRDIIVNNKIRFKEKIHFHEDNIFMLEYLAVVRRVKFVSGANYFYKYETSSLSFSYHSSDETYLYYWWFKKIILHFNDNFDVLSHNYLNYSVASIYMHVFISMYKNKVEYKERVRIFKKYRTKKNLQYISKYLRINNKKPISVLLFLYSWILFDFYSVIKSSLRSKI